MDHVSGRKLNGMLVSGTNETALIRFLPSQRLYRIPLERLNAPDQEYARSRARDLDNFDAEYPPVANQWQGMGLTLEFVENPNLDNANFKGGVGVDFTPPSR